MKSTQGDVEGSLYQICNDRPAELEVAALYTGLVSQESIRTQRFEIVQLQKTNHALTSVNGCPASRSLLESVRSTRSLSTRIAPLVTS